MTVAIGVVCHDGVVVGADREHSLATLKVEDTKAHILKRNNVSIGLVGSGTSDLITLAAQELDRRLSDEMSMDDVRVAVDDLAQEFQAKHIQTNTQSNHKLDLLLGVKTMPRDGVRQVGLLKVNGTIVIWRDRFDAVGWGGEFALCVLSALYGPSDKPSVARGIMLVSHALKAAKAFTQYSGGPSDVIQVRLGYVAGCAHETTCAFTKKAPLSSRRLSSR